MGKNYTVSGNYDMYYQHFIASLFFSEKFSKKTKNFEKNLFLFCIYRYEVVRELKKTYNMQKLRGGDGYFGIDTKTKGMAF